MYDRPRYGVPPLIAYALVLLAFAGGVLLDRFGLLPGTVPQPADLQPTFDEAWDLVMKHYVNRQAIKPKEMTQGAIHGMLDSLGDFGHTTYLTRTELETELDHLKGQYVGIGAILNPRRKDMPSSVRQTLPDSPAQKAGLKKGDILLEIDGKKVDQISPDRVASQVRGPAGTAVKLKVLRKGRPNPLTLKITRARIDFPSVTWTILPGLPIAHIGIREFGQKTDAQLRDILTKARDQGIKGLLVDMRGNAGGLKDQAVAVTSEFLKGGTVFIERDAQGKETAVPVKTGGLATDIPMCVLIDRGSASSSEIFAGALQDYGRAKLVGMTTFGTGTVLQAFTLTDGSALLLAVREWFTPKGRQIWHKGIAPDVKVVLPADADLLTPFEEHGLTAEELKKTTDKQFLTALDILKKELHLDPKAVADAKKP